MALLLKKPHKFSKIIDAIVQLKEKRGSTQKQIIQQISHIRNANPERVAVQVRYGLEYGLNAGLLKQRNGRYTVRVNKKEVLKRQKNGTRKEMRKKRNKRTKPVKGNSM